MLRPLLLIAATALATNLIAEEADSWLVLQLHKPGQKIQINCPSVERKAIEEHFALRSDELILGRSLDLARTDFADTYAIVVGSNGMNQFEGVPVEKFQHMVRFVEEGGHLIFFGTFNGWHFDVAKQLMFRCGPLHNSKVEFIEKRTNALFYGHESKFPVDGKMQSWGNFRALVPHISLLARGAGGERQGEPAFATWCIGSGRVSVTMVEPESYNQSTWFAPVVVDWVRRGGPTRIEDVKDREAMSDPITVAQSRLSNGFVLNLSAKGELKKEVEGLLEELDPARLNDPEQLVQVATAQSDLLKRSIQLELAAALAADLVDLSTAFDAIQQAGQWAFIDIPKEKVNLLQRALKAADASNAARVAEAALDEIPWFAELYLYDEAKAFAEAAVLAADKADDEHLRELAAAALLGVGRKHAAMEANQELLDQWRENPADKDVLDRVGRFLAFQMNDWELGLDCLAKSENIVLSDLARQSIDRPAEATLVIRLGDRWREVAEARDKNDRANIDEFVRQMYRDIGDDIRQASAADRRRAMDFIAAGPTVKDSVTVSLTLDGYGILTITPKEARWETKSGLEPDSIQLGRHEWSNVAEPIANVGSSRFLKAAVDLSTAKLSNTSGRGLIRFVDRTPEAVVVRINDLPRGEDGYEFELTFGE